MTYLLIVSLLIYAAYINQTTYINYLLLLCLLLGIFSFIVSIITYFTVYFDIHINKGICYKGQEKIITFNSSSLLHPAIIVKVVLYNRQLKKKQGTFYIKVKTDGAEYAIPTEECGSCDVIIKKYYVRGFFGVIRLKKKYDKKYYFKIYPKPGEYKKEDIREIAISGDGTPINKKGEDFQELYEIRPIQPDDNLRHIHPSLSAKFGKYMIKVGSKTERKLMLYEMKETNDFLMSINDLKKIGAMYNDLHKDNNNYFCVRYKKKWHIILNKRSLFGLFDLVYKDFEK